MKGKTINGPNMNGRIQSSTSICRRSDVCIKLYESAPFLMHAHLQFTLEVETKRQLIVKNRN